MTLHSVTSRRRQGQKIASYDDDGLLKELWRIDWKRAGYPFCGIYVVTPDNLWPSKVGISTNPTRRLISLQCACWKPLQISEYRYCDTQEAARAVEARVHGMLDESGLGLSGEWFDLRPDKALDAIEFAASVLGVEIRSDIPDDRARILLQEWRLSEGMAGGMAG
jgi:hypothetical protein